MNVSVTQDMWDEAMEASRQLYDLYFARDITAPQKEAIERIIERGEVLEGKDLPRFILDCRDLKEEIVR